ncbi:conserved hypothetical protein, partial [Ricinus communis]
MELVDARWPVGFVSGVLQGSDSTHESRIEPRQARRRRARQGGLGRRRAHHRRPRTHDHADEIRRKYARDHRAHDRFAGTGLSQFLADRKIELGCFASAAFGFAGRRQQRVQAGNELIDIARVDIAGAGGDPFVNQTRQLFGRILEIDIDTADGFIPEKMFGGAEDHIAHQSCRCILANLAALDTLCDDVLDHIGIEAILVVHFLRQFAVEIARLAQDHRAQGAAFAEHLEMAPDHEMEPVAHALDALQLVEQALRDIAVEGFHHRQYQRAFAAEIMQHGTLDHIDALGDLDDGGGLVTALLEYGARRFQNGDGAVLARFANIFLA